MGRAAGNENGQSASPRRSPATGSPSQARELASVSQLRDLIYKEARNQRLTQVRMERRVAAAIITAVLARALDAENEQLFLLKGGMALELRLGLRARATQDYDAAFRGKMATILDELDRTLSEPWQGFTIERIDEPERIKNTNALRFSVRVRYEGTVFTAMKLEIAPVEGAMGDERDSVPAPPLDAVRITGPEDAECVTVRYQVAQKLHACTEVFDTGRENNRFRDIMDILLLEAELRSQPLERAKEACIDIFDYREKHAWPPAVTVYDSWRAPFQKLASDNSFEPDDIDEAVAQVHALIVDINNA